MRSQHHGQYCQCLCVYKLLVYYTAKLFLHDGMHDEQWQALWRLTRTRRISNTLYLYTEQATPWQGDWLHSRMVKRTLRLTQISPTPTPWNQNVLYRFHITPLVHTLSQTNPIQVLRKDHFNIIFPTNLSAFKRSLLFRFSNYNFVRVCISSTLATRLAMNQTSVHVTEIVIHIYSRLIKKKGQLNVPAQTLPL